MSNPKIFFRVFKYMKPVQGKYFAGSALASLELIMLFSIPVVNRMLVEMITGHSGAETVQYIVFMMAGLLALTPLVVIGRYWQSLCAQKTADNLKKALFAHMQRLSLEILSKWKTGDYLMRVTNDADWAGNMVQGYAMVSLLRFFVVTTVSMVLLVITDWRIAALAFGYNLICFGLSLVVNPYVNRLEREARKEIAVSSNIVLETMRSLPVVRVLMLGPVLAEQYRSRCEAIRQKRAKFRAANGVVYGVTDFFSFSAQAVGFIAAIFLLSRGEMALSDAVYTASLMALGSDAMLRLSTFILLIQPPLVAAGRVFEILDEPSEMEKASTTRIDTKHPEAIRLKDVTFTYPDGTEALSRIDLTILK
ncbi:MAG: ABC transporter ATP-binding protein/permease [Defluviitaleaceae bacterium]|nr:ABC transporter ATP-binding protein/permease [Defluviitaleaceae bacterium]